VSLVMNGVSHVGTSCGCTDMGHGAPLLWSTARLDEALIFDTCQEMYFHVRKNPPIFAVFARKITCPSFHGAIELWSSDSQEGAPRGN